MTEWYHARGGKQNGPVSFEQLVATARAGGLAATDPVWTSTMKDWTPAGQVPGIFGAPAPAAPPVGNPSNPYAAPDSSWSEVARITAGEALEEIVPGSEPLDVGGCVKRGFDLTFRNIGMILLIMIVYIAVTMAASTLLALVDSALGWGNVEHATVFESGTGTTRWSVNPQGSALNSIVSQVLSIFLSLGATRIGLNLVSGKEFDIGMLFGGGRQLLPAIGASILYGLMVFVGLVLVIFPGIYLAMRYGQYLTAMVDRNLGIMEAFQYSSSITTNNRMNWFLLLLLSIAIVIAGFLALCVGVFFAFPVVWLGWLVAYRWLQYGHRAALDHPGTVTPMLAGL